LAVDGSQALIAGGGFPTGHEIEDCLPEVGQPLLADTLAAEQGGGGGRLFAGDRPQRLVVQDRLGLKQANTKRQFLPLWHGECA